MQQKIVWAISGTDSSAGAGLLCDLKTFEHLGVHGCCVVTAVTAQNNRKIQALAYVAPALIAAQIAALKQELAPAAIKIGMLGKLSTMKTVGRYLADYEGPVILDPLLQASSGKDLFGTELNSYLFHLKQMLKVVDLVTPNVREAELLLKRRLNSYAAIEEGAQEILALGVPSVLIKGGHGEAKAFSEDYWTDGQSAFWLSSPRQAPCNYRGSGCTLASAIAASLALGYSLKDALVIAKMYINRGLRLAEPRPPKAAFMAHAGWPEEERDLPYLSYQPLLQPFPKFPPCDPQGLGLYPVVDSFTWVARLLPVGVRTLQLRIKDKQGLALEKEIQASIALAKRYKAKLFINDFWELAIGYGAYGVHLGQDDIRTADVQKLQQAGLRLGLSTHCYYEVAHAHSFKPSYLACGPIFPTTSKMMPFAPQGTAQLKRWRRTLGYPLVAIGGINAARLPEILATQVDGVAMIAEITQAPDPLATTQKLLAMVKQHVADRE